MKGQEYWQLKLTGASSQQQEQDHVGSEAEYKASHAKGYATGIMEAFCRRHIVGKYW
ncbi:hypothetical protein SCP_1600980 [Sparassis crispa]|uniref:Uncharacterized protein n=1 Tax=Sparassis crispa TaxID=139825 RepID=A0A401H4Q9_9APHY|nr:hypothetical protein SCP_1600980 [Sparassis crispa]GBE89436.1 hypothetical protein SCP_1600980 [Sparassis crispa]